MPGPLFHVGATALCAHGAGAVQVISSNTRVFVGGMPVATMADMAMIAGCLFAPGGVAQPCLRVQWITPAARVLVNGQPALLQTSSGLGLGPTQAPQGPVLIVATQPRVIGT
ncbi:hypothetical protein [uncultured Rhodoblastus sp.]|uniref:hypothetical protein n=1 Tax=uncultured Rhodoblastus sp. TaxID=543037 RepID=UPI0025FD7868|nr:hypothetical protein [uncultured Rhodoblastus sp.]